MSKTVEVFSANANGTTGRYPVTIDLTDDLLFKIDLPSYISETLVMGAFVSCPTAQGAIDAYESAADSYSRKVLAINAQRELFVQIRIVPGGMALRLHQVACQKADDTGEIQAVIINPDETIGEKIDLASGRIIPDTEENRAQVQRLIDSIDTAAQILIGLRETEDPVSYLHQIRNDFTLNPTPEEKPVQSPADDDEYAL